VTSATVTSSTVTSSTVTSSTSTLQSEISSITSDSSTSTTTVTLVPGTTSPNAGQHIDGVSNVWGFIFIVCWTIFLAAMISVIYFRNIIFIRPAYRSEPLTKLDRDNIVTIFSLPIEFLQLSVFGLALKQEWTRRFKRVAQLSIFDLSWFFAHNSSDGNTDTFDYLVYIFWIVFVSTTLWCLMIVPMLLRSSVMSVIRKNRIAKAMFGIGIILIGPFASFLVLPCIRMLLRFYQCARDNDGMYTVVGQNMVCYKGQHWIYIIMGTFGFTLYFPLVIYTLPRIQTASSSEILRNTRFLYNQKMLYVLLLLSQTQEDVRLAVTND